MAFPCSEAWHACLLHAGCCKPYIKEDRGKQLLSGHLSIPARDDKAIKLNPRASRRFQTPEEIIQQDRRRAESSVQAERGIKRKADIILKDDGVLFKKPTCLGPILRERFGGASASAS